ncbi:sigma factor [Mesorhizobium sp. M1143]|uniref:sigma factor n=1 Tax=Mesorhizobium sp. M1143 TaxID=2957061 RepID=UPI00333D21FB
MKEILDEIHKRLLEGSRTASRDLFVAATGPLTGFIVNEFPKLSEDERHDLVVDAILEHLQAPSKYDPSQGSLWSYLCMIAKRNAIDLVRISQRRAKLLDQKIESDVEFWAARAKYMYDGEDAIDARHIMNLHGHRLATNDVEAKILELMLTEEKSTGAYATALGIDPNEPDTERIVKQSKDRLLLRMKRLRDEL